MKGGTWIVHPSTSVLERERLALHGARVVESWWVKAPYWTNEELS